MHNKTKTTILFASLIVALAVPFSMMDVADAKSDDQLRINKKIADIEKNKNDYQKLLETSAKLEDKKFLLIANGASQEKIDKVQSKLDKTYKDMDVLQEINYALFSIPSDKLSYLKDAKENIKKAVDKKDLLISYIDYKTEEIVFIQDPKSIKDLGYYEKIVKKQDLKDKIKNNAKDQKHRLDSIENKGRSSSCQARSNSCNSSMSGLRVEVDTHSTGYGTLGFAADRNGVDGFVITAHQTSGGNSFINGGTVKQGRANVGVVKDGQYDHCDCAFVENNSNKSTDDKIWTSSYGRFTINSYATSTDHTQGTFLRISGVSSDVQSGSILTDPATNFVSTDISMSDGDSGSPVYAGSGSSGKLYGLMWGSTDSGSYYTMYSAIDSYLSLD